MNNPKTASAHNSQLQGRVEPVDPGLLRAAFALESRVRALESALSAAEGRLREIGEIAALSKLSKNCGRLTCLQFDKIYRLTTESEQKGLKP